MQKKSYLRIHRETPKSEELEAQRSKCRLANRILKRLKTNDLDLLVIMDDW